MQPSVTVLMPVFNGERHIAKAIDSILRQTFENFELLIMDDGSTDRTSDIIKAYDDPRIHVHQSAVNRGIERTLNDGIMHAKGKYIARMDADDVSLPERLARQVAFLENHPETGVLGTAVRQIGRKRFGKTICAPLTDREVRVHLLFHNPMLHPTIMFRKELGGRMAIYPLGFRFAEDYRLWTDIADSTGFANLKEALLLYRIHEKQVTRCRQEESRKNTNIIRADYLKRNFPDIDKQDIELHVSVMQNCHNIPLHTIGCWLEKLSVMNLHSRKFDQDILLENLAVKWLDCCRKSPETGKEIHGIFKSYPLSGHVPAKMKNKMKYYFKVLCS